MKHLILALILFQSLNFQAISQNIKMNGVITDSETKNPIEFVNIGILNKNKGTITNLNGEFNLTLTKAFKKDSLTISHVNYYPLKISIKNVKNQVILLKPKTNELPEIFVLNKKKRNRKIGIKSYNPFLWVCTISKDNDIIENAQRINIPDKMVRIKYANVYLRRGFESDSGFIRVNFYENIDNTPGKRIVFQNIVRKKQIKPGWLKIDLIENSIYLKEDFFIGIEFIPDFKNTLLVYLGGILTKGKGYQRRNSQGKWSKTQGASTINVEIEY